MDEYLYVVRPTCADCLYLPIIHEKFSALARQRGIAWGHDGKKAFECSSVTVARADGKLLPEHVVCYVWFYQYWQECPEIKAFVEQGKVRYLDTTGWKTLTESQYLLLSQEEPVRDFDMPSISAEQWEESQK